MSSDGFALLAVVALCMATKARIELDAGTRRFATGLLPELIGALRNCGPGDLLAVISSEKTGSALTLKLGAALRATP